MSFANAPEGAVQRGELFRSKIGSLADDPTIDVDQKIVLFQQASDWAQARWQFLRDSGRFIDTIRTARAQQPRNGKLMRDIAARVIAEPQGVVLGHLQAVRAQDNQYSNMAAGDAIRQLKGLHVLQEQTETRRPIRFGLTQLCMMTMVELGQEAVDKYMNIGIQIRRHNPDFTVASLLPLITDPATLDTTPLSLPPSDNS